MIKEVAIRNPSRRCRPYKIPDEKAPDADTDSDGGDGKADNDDDSSKEEKQKA